ncbi:hypothetical protein GCM10010252_26220 [Streptomyces aureoverticillatus]|nr:hypothetical protein GCM10010252_26220 [Streptomyces aureoverticillatus]
MARMGGILGWSKAKRWLLSCGSRAAYLYERCGGWRRMTTLKVPPPELRNALGRPTVLDVKPA